MRSEFHDGAKRGAQSLDDRVNASLGSSSPKRNGEAPLQDGDRNAAAKRLIALAGKLTTLHRVDDETGVAVRNDRPLAYRIPSSTFESYLRGAYYAEEKVGLSKQAVESALQTILARAVHEGETVVPHLRVASHQGCCYVDMGDDSGAAIKIGPKHQSVIAVPPVIFVRTRSILPFPHPEFVAINRENLERYLWRHLNVPLADRILVLAYLCECWRDETPYPVLELDGPQGSAKSTTHRRLRDLIDPCVAPLRGRPRTTEDIWVAARNAHAICFENISSLSTEQQDAICSLATGGGHGGRLLYTNGEEHVIEAKRPVLINGIGGAATRPDLIDRLIHLDLPEINATARKSEADLDREWRSDYPKALGLVMTVFAMALEQLPNVDLEALPRMADFGRLGIAVARSVGLEDSAFGDRYAENRRDGGMRALESTPVAPAILSIIEQAGGCITLRYSELVKRLHERTEIRRDDVPRSERALGALLKRIGPALQMRGVEMACVRKEHGYEVTFRPPAYRESPT